MADFSRVTPDGWEQGDDASAFARVTPNGWTQVNAAATSDVTVNLSGQAVTASAGTLTVSVSTALSGQSATASAGTLTPSVSISLSGQEVTASAGTLTPTITIALSGQSVTASAGTITYNAGNDLNIALSGQEVTSSAGTLSVGTSIALSGQGATASAGTLTPELSFSLSGQAVTASAGTVTYSANQDVTIALSGETVTTYAGTISTSGGSAAVQSTGVPGGPVFRRTPYLVYIDGKRYIGTEEEIRELIEDFAEQQAEKAIAKAKTPKKPRIVVEPGKTVSGKVFKDSTPPPQVAQVAMGVQSDMRRLYVEAYARALAEIEAEEEESIISLL